MKRTLTTLAFIFILSFSFGQKVKIKKDVIYVDGMEYLTFKKERDGSLINISYYDLKGEEVAYLAGHEYWDYTKASQGNEEGRVYYTELSITGVEKTCEVEGTLNNLKKVAKILYRSQLVSPEGVVNLEKAQTYMKRKGNKHTRRILQLEEEQRKRDEIELEKAKRKNPLIIINN